MLCQQLGWLARCADIVPYQREGGRPIERSSDLLYLLLLPSILLASWQPRSFNLKIQHCQHFWTCMWTCIWGLSKLSPSPRWCNFCPQVQLLQAGSMRSSMLCMPPLHWFLASVGHGGVSTVLQNCSSLASSSSWLTFVTTSQAVILNAACLCLPAVPAENGRC